MIIIMFIITFFLIEHLLLKNSFIDKEVFIADICKQ